MMKGYLVSAIALCSLVIMAGCGDPPLRTEMAEASGPPKVGRPTDESKAALKKQEQEEKKAEAEAKAAKAAAQQANAKTDETADNERTEKIKATVGVGSKGHYDYQGYTTAVVGTLFRAQESMFFNQVKSSLTTFYAINERNPKDHDEFIEKILKPGHLKEPTLPTGQRFEYDPTEGRYGALMVVKPKKKEPKK